MFKSAPKFTLALLGSCIFSSLSYAQYYKTLPAGVRAVVYRNVKTSTIKSSYNHTNAETPFNYEIKVDVKTLEGMDNEKVKIALDLLKPYDDAYNSLNFGTYKVEAEADAVVDGYGFAQGLTNQVTAYMALPLYKAKVKMKYTRSESNSYDKVADSLQNITDDVVAQSVGDAIEQIQDMADLDGQMLQNIAVNSLGYNEVGDWAGSGPGDLEFGLMYNFLTTDTFGAMVKFGGVAPTGAIDDPDTIQDIGFGDGQWDAFVELGGGYRITDWFFLNSYARYTYQFASHKELRIPLSEDVFISDEKDTFREKLGNKILFNLGADIIVNDWLTVIPSYEASYIAKAKYESENGDADDWLASNTESNQHNIRLTTEFSTVTLFTKGKFLLPASIRFSAQKMIDGLNTPKVDRYEVEYRMFF